MSQDIIFRRIKGRIVPIKLTKDQKERIKEATKATGFIAAGIGVAATSGRTYRSLVVKSADKAMKAFTALEELPSVLKKSSGQLSLFDYAKKADHSTKVYNNLRRSAKIGDTARILRAGSIPVGAALIGYGAIKGFNSLPKKQQKKVDPALAAGGGAALAVAAPRVVNLAKDAFEAGIGGRQGVMKFGSSRFSKILPKLKQAGGYAFKAFF